HLALFSQAHAGKLLRSILDFPCPWEGILHRNALLAADCLADDVQVPPALRDETLRKLAELLVNPAGQVREAAAELCQRLAATRHRAPAAAMVKTLPNRPGPGVVRALVSLGERDAAAPLIDLLGKDEGQKLRFEGWPEKADDLLAEWLDSGELSVKIGRDLATCTFGALSAERIRERLGDEGFLRFLEQRAARHPALSLSLSLSLQWITALASDPPASEKIRQLLSSKPPGQIRLWAAIHLLGSEHRATAITVLQELSSERELKATEALVEADPETVVDWTPVRRTVFRGRRDAVLAIRLLLKGGQVDTGVALLYHLLATEPVHLIVHRGRPTQPFRALAADLVSARRAEPAVALARWLALRPGQDHRVSACEVLLALGEIEEAIRLLTWAAYECHGNVSRRACERLLALGEAELAVPILGQLAASERPDLRYQAALALALANRAPEQLGEVPPEGDKWELTRIRLKTDILADRRRAYRSSLDQLYHAGIAALPPTDPSDPDLAAVTTLAQVSLGWLSGREPVGEETAAIPAKVDPIEADVATALCMLELRRGRLEPGTSQLLTLAKRPDLPPWVRLWVLELFGLIHCRSAIPLLRQASEDPEPAVRATAVEALAQLRLKENADVLVRALRDPDPWVRQVATEGVTKTRDPNAVEALLELLSDKERNIRRQAIAALAVIGNPEAVRGLIRAFEDEDRDPHERRLVIKALIQVADRSSREALAGALSSNDPWLPIAAGAALATLGDSRGCEVLIAALGSEDQWFRNSAANALAALTDPAFTPRLIRLLSHEDAQVRSEIALVLGRRADPAAAPALTKALADEDSRVRANAALTLGWFEHVPATGALIGLLGDEADEVRCQVVLALGFLPAPIDVLLEALGDDGFRVGEAALRSLGRSNDPAAGCALLAALEHEDAWTRAAAANALERRGSIEAVPALIRALGDGIHVVRQHAATALGGLRDRRALRPLTALLNDSAENVCEAAATALGRLQDRAAVDPLIQVLEDIHSGVGSAAVKALGRIGDSAAVPPLIAMAVKFVERGAYYKSLLAPIAQALARLNAVEAVPLLVAIAVPEPEYLSALVHLDAGKARELLDRFATPLRLASWRQRLHGQALWQLGDPDAALLCFREAVSEH
ncbi:MAG: hypothetical protein GY856_01410, partial [bacterium]|nr:hypothetical protein [bacterium]